QKRAETQARQQAENSAESARRNRDAALDALDELVINVQEELLDRPALDDVKQSLLQHAVNQLQGVADLTRVESDPLLGAAHAHLGNIFLQLGRLTEAQHQFELCQAIAGAFLTTDPMRDRSENALCTSTAKLGEIRLRLNDLPGAERLCKEAMGLAEAFWQSS